MLPSCLALSPRASFVSLQRVLHHTLPAERAERRNRERQGMSERMILLHPNVRADSRISTIRSAFLWMVCGRTCSATSAFSVVVINRRSRQSRQVGARDGLGFVA